MIIIILHPLWTFCMSSLCCRMAVNWWQRIVQSRQILSPRNRHSFRSSSLPWVEFMTICIVSDSTKHIAMFSALRRQAESKVHMQPPNFIFKRGPSCSNILEQLSIKAWRIHKTISSLHNISFLDIGGMLSTLQVTWCSSWNNSLVKWKSCCIMKGDG